jgi:hypothetical protein
MVHHLDPRSSRQYSGTSRIEGRCRPLSSAYPGSMISG